MPLPELEPPELEPPGLELPGLPGLVELPALPELPLPCRWLLLPELPLLLPLLLPLGLLGLAPEPLPLELLLPARSRSHAAIPTAIAEVKRTAVHTLCLLMVCLRIDVMSFKYSVFPARPARNDQVTRGCE